MRNADIAMYAAKRSLGNDFLVYEPGMGDTTVTRKDSAAELAAAIRDGEMRTVYQPLIDMRTGRPIGAEALVRWQHPVDGLRSPDQFIGLAEDSGLITEIGAAGAQRRLPPGRPLGRRDARPHGPPGHGEPVGAPGRPTTRSSSRSRAALDASGLEPHRLVLEITETVLMHDRDAAAATLWQLKGLGVRIAIDDFGTGYSSLAYLRRFPIDMLKVAREFVDGLGRDAHDDVITRAIVELANTLGLLTVAEGIETTQQSETLAALGCDIAQGYLFSRPIEADAVSAVMAASAWSAIGAPVRPALEAGRRRSWRRRADRRSGRGDQPRGLDQQRLLAAPRRPGVVALGLLPRAERGPVQQLPLPHLGGVRRGRRRGTGRGRPGRSRSRRRRGTPRGSGSRAAPDGRRPPRGPARTGPAGRSRRRRPPPARGGRTPCWSTCPGTSACPAPGG